MVQIHDQFGEAAANGTLLGADEILVIGRRGRLGRVSRDIPGLSESKHTEGTGDD